MDIKAGDWIVIENWGYDLVQASSVKPQTVTYTRPHGGREGRVSLTKVVFAHADQEKALAVKSKLESARGERQRRESAAREWFRTEKERICWEASA